MMGPSSMEKDSSDDWLTTWGPVDDQSGGGPFNSGLVAETHRFTRGAKDGSSAEYASTVIRLPDSEANIPQQMPSLQA